MKFVYGDLSLDVPDGWTRTSKARTSWAASQIGFMAPPDTSLAKDYAKQAAAAGAPVRMEVPADPKSRANFTFTTRPWFLSMPPKEFCDAELKAMIAQIPNAKAGPLATLTVAGAEGTSEEVELSMQGMALKQLHVLVVIGDRILHFVGTAGLGDYPKHREQFLAAVQSIAPTATE